MDNKLLVRSYNVGCGDCFYVRIPNDDDGFHILIDCGTKESESSTKILKRAIEHLIQNELPVSKLDNKEKRLDLIVVTHRHEDHIKGFSPEYFKKIEIKNIWVTAAMNENHQQAKDSFGLHQLATEKMQELSKSRARLSPELQGLIQLYSIDNERATQALLTDFKRDNPNMNLEFVYAGKNFDNFDNLKDDTEIIVLAPEEDIDGYYLGEEADQSLRGIQAGISFFQKKINCEGQDYPTNITRNDFIKLKSRVLSNALAFSVLDSDIQNNVSVVLLIIWRSYRLLFVGDAMWEGKFKEGIKNGSWNVMWKKRNNYLKTAVDFLKVGHHGSHNSTPWNRDTDSNDEVNKILDAILPMPKNGEKPKAQAIVSTKRTKYDTIPDAELLVEIGKRVCNSKSYLAEFESNDQNFNPYTDIYRYSKKKKYSGEPKEREIGEVGWLDKPQPVRTDMESEGKGQEKMLIKCEFIDVNIPPPL